MHQNKKWSMERKPQKKNELFYWKVCSVLGKTLHYIGQYFKGLSWKNSHKDISQSFTHTHVLKIYQKSIWCSSSLNQQVTAEAAFRIYPAKQVFKRFLQFRWKIFVKGFILALLYRYFPYYLHFAKIFSKH